MRAATRYSSGTRSTGSRWATTRATGADLRAVPELSNTRLVTRSGARAATRSASAAPKLSPTSVNWSAETVASKPMTSASHLARSPGAGKS
eukprot:IDg23210t1